MKNIFIWSFIAILVLLIIASKGQNLSGNIGSAIILSIGTTLIIIAFKTIMSGVKQWLYNIGVIKNTKNQDTK